MTRRRGRPLKSGPLRVAITTTQPASLVDWLRAYTAERGIPMAAVITRSLLEYREKIEADAGGGE